MQLIFHKNTVINKEFLINHLQEKLTPHQDSAIFQSSSGTTGKPLVLARSYDDIKDISQRVLKKYLNHYGEAPNKIALLGGVSHTEAALNLNLGNIIIRSFSLQELDKLKAFSPEVISCYPSIIREIFACPNLHFPNLKALKLGGEPLFTTDLHKVFKRFPNIIVLEQYGSTEMPALALRVFKSAEENVCFELETNRFDFLIKDQEDWQPVIAKDNLPSSIFNFNAFYDTGDEGIFLNNQLVKVRRRNSSEDAYLESIQQMLKLGCTNAQFDLKAKQLRYSGTINPPHTIKVKNEVFKVIQSELLRLPQSNKLPLVI